MTSKDTVIVLQARIGSTRLPGKVLAPLAGRSILSHCIARLRRSGLRVVVATTTNSEDDPVAAEAWRHGVDVLRGPERDVLARFVPVADRLGARNVIRATADNPVVDFDAPSRVLRTLIARDADYAVEIDLPVGTGVEAVRADALRAAAGLAGEDYDRDHVTSYIRRNRQRFHVIESGAPGRLRRPDLRLTVDTPADLDFVRTLLKGAGGYPGELLSLAEILGAAERMVPPRHADRPLTLVPPVAVEVA
jgi:spore coat polysaccharide biosynthesis protein SpsF